MQKLLFYFVALFILFFACSQNQSEEKTNTNVPANTAPNVTEAVIPTPIPAPKKPDVSNLKPIPQASKKDLVYPDRFQQSGVRKFKGAKVTNNNMIDNSLGKYGQRINLSSSAKYDDVLAFYKADLTKNGWEHNAKMDKSHKDEDVTFFATNYTKDNYTLMISVTALGADNTSVSQILKEN